MHVLVAGGCGYIGSHTAVALIEAGHSVSVVDDLSNSSVESLRRVEQITGVPVAFHHLDLRDRPGLDTVFSEQDVDAVIHFAGLKAVGESVHDPLRYWDVNVGTTLCLLGAMRDHNVKRMVFSSSATVYGDPDAVPIPESAPIRPTNPYGQTKAAIESLLCDLAGSGQGYEFTLLRYFNPVGAHPSGRMGEDPAGVPNNLLPFVAQVAVGRREELMIFGGDYPTPDGTGVRDYIHVMDLAEGHVAALERSVEGVQTLNLGTGEGASVLDVVKAFSDASGRSVPFRIVERRAGDVAFSYADVTRAGSALGWSAKRSLAEACIDTWRWQEANPDGYR